MCAVRGASLAGVKAMQPPAARVSRGALLELSHAVSFDAIRSCLKARFKPAFHAASEEALELGRSLAQAAK